MNAINVPTCNDAAPISSPAEAEQLVRSLTGAMDDLLALVEEETKLVRAGRLKEASKLERRKAELARTYVADSTRLKASTRYVSAVLPGVVDVLRHRHEIFRAMLQMNLTVLATAHAVSEGIMRGVSEEMTRKMSPQVYGASGRQSPPGAHRPQPLAISRVL